ncbi:MAG: hypothetical protein V4739_15490 [Pseudomonadota bacterium]
MRHAKALIRGFLKRWSIYLLLGPAILSAGSNAPVALASALAGTLVLPLFNAAQDLPWLLPIGLLYALAGTLPVLLTRPLWWPYRWADAERALPLSADAVRRSDRTTAMWMMLPWQCLLLIGCVALGWLDPSRRGPALAWVAGGWASSTACALALSVAWMRWVRHRATRSVLTGAADHGGGRAVTPAQPLAPIATPSVHWTTAYFLLALRRGPARGSARILASGMAATVACGLGTLSTLNVGWPLAALALVALGATGMLRSRSGIDLQPLQQANQHLPIAPRRWRRARTLLILVPTLAGGLALLPGALTTPGLRPGMLLVYVILVGSGCAWEAVALDKTANRTARWLLMLVLTTAISFEMASP